MLYKLYLILSGEIFSFIYSLIVSGLISYYFLNYFKYSENKIISLLQKIIMYSIYLLILLYFIYFIYYILSYNNIVDCSSGDSSDIGLINKDEVIVESNSTSDSSNSQNNNDSNSNNNNKSSLSTYSSKSSTANLPNIDLVNINESNMFSSFKEFLEELHQFLITLTPEQNACIFNSIVVILILFNVNSLIAIFMVINYLIS